MKFKSLVLISFFLFLAEEVKGQTLLQGNIYSAKDSTALFGASVYFDGTSLGVSTNEKGEFKITVNETTTSSLVISSLGYETIVINSSDLRKRAVFKVFLPESTEALPEVVLEPDPWSRERKLRVFIREFLGSSMAASRCRIRNPEIISLTYIPSKEVLIAEAKEPLKIINRHLGYEVTYNLTDFRVEFSTGTSGLQLVTKVYFEGLSFFEELQKSPSKKFRRNRKSAYTGSSQHFLRSLASNSLSENEFKIFRKGFEVAPQDYFRLNKNGDLVQVEIIENPITILYKEVEQSAVRAENTFSIDHYGNHTPPYELNFSGYMAEKRAAEMLPLNYGLN